MVSINYVVELKPFKTIWKIKVKVIRLWKLYSTAECETIEMVLCDIKGDKIYASIKKDVVSQFDPFLKQGDSKMLLSFHVRNCLNISGFQPVKYKEVLDGTLNFDYLVDIYGSLVCVGELEEVGEPGGPMKPKSCFYLNRSGVNICDMISFGVGGYQYMTNIEECSKIDFEPNILKTEAFRKL
ncbi:hypothetical protein N665_0614s0001 [Sinapis alba]|nr:hypothetical protein N665_0614s0001 [Sinapis alba]